MRAGFSEAMLCGLPQDDVLGNFDPGRPPEGYFGPRSGSRWGYAEQRAGNVKRPNFSAKRVIT